MSLSRREHFDLFYYLLLTRRAEEKMRTAYQEGQKDPKKKLIAGNFYPSTNQEAVPVGVAFAAKLTDWIAHTHRDLGALLVHERFELVEILANMFGRAEGPTRGRDSGLNFGSREKRTVPKHVFMGMNLTIANGVAWELKNQGDGVILAFSGDGASSEGFVHDAMNWAGVGNYPIVFVFNNNQWAISTPVERQVAGGSIAKRAEGYGFPGIVVDGTDILAVYQATSQAINRARAGLGPTLIEAKTFRLSGHALHDDPLAYMNPELWKEQQKPEHDPLVKFQNALLAQGASRLDFAVLEEGVQEELDLAWEEALKIAPASAETKGWELFAEEEK